MNVLVLSTWFPYPADNGSRLRAWHLLRRLQSCGHHLHLIAGVQEDALPLVFPSGTDTPPCLPAPLASICETVQAVPWEWYRGGGGIKDQIAALASPVPLSIARTQNPRLQATIAQALASRPDACLVLELGMDAYLPPPAETDVPLVLEQVEVSGARQAAQSATSPAARLRASLMWQKSERYWHKRFQRYAALTAVSDAEARAVRAVVGSDIPPVVMIPNGVDLQTYPAALPSERIPGRLLYNGALTYGPNRDAVDWFTRDILPQIAQVYPDAHLLVTGRYDADGDLERRLRTDPRVTLTGFVPDIAPLVSSAAVAVVPLLGGGGTRLKILEAWAAHVPVVSTTIGASGLDARPGQDLEIADNADDFARTTIALLQNPERVATLARNARTLVETRYDWAAIGADLSALLERVASTPRP